ncbi:hypothetical protein EWH21_02785 [Pseudomonas sp. REST10]|uniref:hypothetical protein n=1 Tax=Pseudomonas sp. REST10 TaxID=2512235 RepID=UPI00240E53DD|nr:hypothetical protein [Pseudomonas sp. REST10]WFC60676.1 hypothetical protein EWH21_02785 [Pseudomonas sp. REST10]
MSKVALAAALVDRHQAMVRGLGSEGIVEFAQISCNAALAMLLNGKQHLPVMAGPHHMMQVVRQYNPPTHGITISVH